MDSTSLTDSVEGGIEDFVRFDQKPAREVMSYDVDVSHAAGLRLVANVLELLDADGAPRIRMRSPYVVDSAGGRRDAHIMIHECNYDSSGVAPWGRPVVAPGSSSCHVEISWGDARGG